MNPLAADLDHVLTHTSGLWEEFRGRRIFITGGTGFFGCWLLESFCWANDRLDLRAEVVVLTRNPESFRAKAPHLACHPVVRLHVGDVRTFEFPSGHFSHIIHAAAATGPKINDEQPFLMFDTIVTGTRRALDFAIQANARNFLLASSGAVYGRQPPELDRMPEDYSGAPDSLNPTSTYGEGKRAAELLCALYAKQHGLQAKIARCFAFVGPYLPLNTQFAIGNFIRDACAGVPIRVHSDGTPYRSYLYAADLTIWLWTILLRGVACRPYNVGSEDARPIAEMASIVAKLTGVNEVIMGPAQRMNPPARYVPAIQRAGSEMNLDVWINLPDALRRTLAYYMTKTTVAC